MSRNYLQTLPADRVRMASDPMEIQIYSQRPVGILLNVKIVLDNFIEDSAALKLKIALFERPSLGSDSCLGH